MPATARQLMCESWLVRFPPSTFRRPMNSDVVPEVWVPQRRPRSCSLSMGLSQLMLVVLKKSPDGAICASE